MTQRRNFTEQWTTKTTKSAEIRCLSSWSPRDRDWWSFWVMSCFCQISIHLKTNYSSCNLFVTADTRRELMSSGLLHWNRFSCDNLRLSRFRLETTNSKVETLVSRQTHLSQLLMNTQVVHHHDPINYLQQGLICDWLIGLLQRSPQQQAVVTMASLDFGLNREETNRKE